MSTPAQKSAERDATLLRHAVESHRRQVRARPAPAAVGVCRADGWSVGTEHLDGDYDLDTPLGQEMLRRLVSQRPDVLTTLSAWEPKAFMPVASRPSSPAAARTPTRPEENLPPWMHDYLFGSWGGQGVGSELNAAGVGPGNIVGNAMGAAQGAAYAGMQTGTAGKLAAGAQRVASGAARSVRINDYMELYNANQGKGRPRPRLRVRGLPVQVITPIEGTAAWRSNARGTTHSTRWVNPTPQQMRGAGVAAADARWTRYAGWATGKAGTGILTFAPTLALDTYNAVQFELDAGGKWRASGFDTHKFVIDSAKNQSGNVVGLGASVGAGIGATVMFGAAVAGWPVVLIGLGFGIFAQVVWNATGMNDRAGALAEQALR